MLASSTHAEALIKLLLFGLLCSLGYRLVRAFGRPGGDAAVRSRPNIDRSHVVEAEFEEVDGRPGEGEAP